MTAATFAAVFTVLYIGHAVGDHWVQSSCQADAKGEPGWTGRWACTKHVAGLTATKVLLLAPAIPLLDLEATALGLVLGLGIDAGSHWWADRRTTLARLARLVQKAEFHSLGTAGHPRHPVTVTGKPAAHLGTGAYQLDQSWHILWLGISAMIIATV